MHSGHIVRFALGGAASDDGSKSDRGKAGETRDRAAIEDLDSVEGCRSRAKFREVVDRLRGCRDEDVIVSRRLVGPARGAKLRR
jgi:hypothetical protein